MVEREKVNVPPRILMSRRPVSPALIKAMTFVETLVRSLLLPIKKAPTPPFGLEAGLGSRTSHRVAPPKVVGPVSVTKRVAVVLSVGPLLTINVRDFRRFDDLRVLHPAELSGAR